MSKAVRRVLVAGLLAFVVYPLSYAPLAYAIQGPDYDLIPVLLGEPPELWEQAFRPVMLLHDERTTVVGRWLLRWSDLWGIEKHRVAVRVRLYGPMEHISFVSTPRDGEAGTSN